MDEAERCHRLAFIFRGTLLDVGTPEEIIDRRKLRVAELEVDRAREAAEKLRADPRVEEVAHYGHLLRLVTRDVAPDQVAKELPAELGVRSSRSVRSTVEDAFVAMVRADTGAS
jgi:ABC-2 type transport system ATP-binding protein